MAKTPQETYPPKLQKTKNGEINASSLADLLEWFLNYDPKVGIVRHKNVEELFQWKQKDDAEHGQTPAPFENAESRFAIGAFQAIAENNSQTELNNWISSVVEALGEAKQTNEEIAKNYNLQTQNGESHITEAEKIPTKTEKRLYLSSCWLEALCTAEARFLGWVYQEMYGVPFQPNG
jgi:hypothetical protein